MTSPLRLVVEAHMGSGRGSVLGGDTWRRVRWWNLTLECGHTQQRTVRYRPHPQGYRIAQRVMSDALPAPTRARCHDCAGELASQDALDLGR